MATVLFLKHFLIWTIKWFDFALYSQFLHFCQKLFRSLCKGLIFFPNHIKRCFCSWQQRSETEIAVTLSHRSSGTTNFFSARGESRRIRISKESFPGTSQYSYLAVAVPDPVLRHKVRRGLNTDEAAEPNAFAIDAAIAAFTEGEEWLDALRGYILENKKAAAEYIRGQIPQIEVVPSKATYLLWLHCSRMVGFAVNRC